MTLWPLAKVALGFSVLWVLFGGWFNGILALIALRIVVFLVFGPKNPPAVEPKRLPESYKPSSQYPREQRLCIVGAGFVGLGLAAALKRRGIPIEILEADDDLGGNWKHGVYETVHIISSKKATQYLDYPMPDDYPEFPSSSQMLKYFQDYANHYRLREDIDFNCKVVSVVPLKHTEFKGDNGWRVTLANGEERIYRGVLICIGHHWDPRMPQYPGQDAWRGQILHSKQYKSPEELRKKKVLVVGGGNSACDIAVEAARFASESHLSVRRGYWFMPRTFFGVPLTDLMTPWVPEPIFKVFIKLLLKLVVGNYSRYGLPDPDHDIFEHHPTINSELLHLLKLGSVKPHPDIKEFQPNGKTVTFVDGAQQEIDLVIFATGYRMSLPMLKDTDGSSLVEYKEGLPQLLNGLFVPKTKNLYVCIGTQVRYGAGTLVSSSAEALSDMIETQEKCKKPLSVIVQGMGGRVVDKNSKSADILADPFDVFRVHYWGRKIVGWYPTIEKWL